jgi:phage-related protein
VIPTSERIVEHIEVEGREGSLTVEKGWKDITFGFKAALMSSTAQTQWKTVLPQLLDAKTITLSSDPTVHLRIKQVKTSGLKPLLSTLWEFELELVCAPFRYLNDVAMLVRTTSGSVASHGNVYALPLIRVFGTGKRTLTINGKAILLDLQSEYLSIDSELKECHYGNVACNHLMTGDFPIFKLGSNTVTLGTGITKVEIEPRWRVL